jgi:hypothetical protein
MSVPATVVGPGGAVDVGNLPDTYPDQHQQPVTDAEMRATPVPVSGTVDVGNLPDTYPDQHQQPVTDAEMRATPVPVSGTVGTGLDAALDDVKRSITDFETRMDYAARADGNPVYIGKASQGRSTDVTVWTIQKMDFDALSRLVRVQVVSGLKWDDRATAGWT